MRVRIKTTAKLVALLATVIGFHAGTESESAAADKNAKRAGATLKLNLRSRVETAPKSGRFHIVTRAEKWNAKQTAIVVCDMWDLHHCLNATKRGAEMAPRMNRLLKNARDRGVTIIHAPSNCMNAYKGHPARNNALNTPQSKNLPDAIGKWCYQIPAEEKFMYPIDQSDGGEDDDLAEHRKWAKKLKAMGRNPRSPWKSQTDLLTINNADFISDKGEEIWSIMEQRGIDNVILVGVHTNMCVLGRPFGLRQMAKNGKNVVLMRDLTDTMYNPARRPYVSHFTGTDLIVEHIEKSICPTITSVDILGGQPNRFANDHRPRLVIVSAEREYKTEETLPVFAAKHLGKHFQVRFVFANAKERNDLPGIDILKDADIALISVRRRVIPKKQLDVIRKFIAAGKPIVGIRTASHAFSLNGGKQPPEGHDSWATFDSEILGGNYKGHHGNTLLPSVRVSPDARKHPILSGIDFSDFTGGGSLYKVLPLSKSATPLLMGTIPNQPREPVAWTNIRDGGARVFYTSLGHPDDFKQLAFNRLLLNGMMWAAGMDVPHNQ